MVIGIILMIAAALSAWAYVRSLPEKAPETKSTGTGVIEYVIPGDGFTRYVIRFTGECNKSHLAKTPAYTGKTDKYPEGKFVHIRYWFGKKAAGAEIIDEELTDLPQKNGKPLLALASGLLFIAGIVCIILL